MKYMCIPKSEPVGAIIFKIGIRTIMSFENYYIIIIIIYKKKLHNKNITMRDYYTFKYLSELK